MSYIRAAHPMVFVEGDSKDYVFLSSSAEFDDEGKLIIKPENDYVEDYDRITNEGIVEILCRYWREDDKKLKEYLVNKIAKRLKVKLREDIIW